MVRKKSKNTCNEKVSGKELKDIEELVLPASKLRFCSEQLQNLNFIFRRNLSKEPELEFAKAVLLAKSVTEKLIQRLLCGVGMLDERFSSKFLVALHDPINSSVSQTLKYIVRLDTLSTPPLYKSDDPPKYWIVENDAENCPPAYARIRLHASCSRKWPEFVNANGFLRRDKVQTRFVELLAMAASGNTPDSPLVVDESTLCGSPGKVMDAFALHKILKIPTIRHVFYGAGGSNPRFPDPRDFKLAIADEPNGIIFRVGFLSPVLAPISIKVHLLVAIELDIWPSTSDFPFRIPLGHSDCVLYHRVAQTGLYLTGFGVHSSAWQIRVPAAEMALKSHYSHNSVVSTIMKTLYRIFQDINEEYGRHQICYKILNKYALKTSLFYELEKDGSSPTETILNWSPKYLSTHVLKILDDLIKALRCQHLPNYFFPKANLLVNPGHLCEGDFTLESNKIQAHMLKFFDESLVSLRTNEEFVTFLSSHKTEMIFLNKWKELMDGLMPPPSTRKRKVCFSGSQRKTELVYMQYTTRQLEYIGIVLQNLLVVKENVLRVTEELPWTNNLNLLESPQENPIEDVIYILVTLVEQAKDKFLESPTNDPNILKAKLKLRSQFDVSLAKLIEAVRKEEGESSMLLDDIALVKAILKWLYKGLYQSKKGLMPILCPYLQTLFVTSHDASWHLETLKQQDILDEINSLGTFGKLVNSGSITPAQGLVDSVGKNWSWAKDMLKLIEEENLRLVFVPERGKVARYILSFPKSGHKTKDKKTTYTPIICNGKHYLNTVISKTFSTKGNEDIKNYKPWYDILRDGSAMTSTLSQLHRRGDHRCCGDILETLIAMQKINVLQEMSTLFPSEHREEILGAFQKFTNERGKRGTIAKRKSNTFIQLSNSKRETIFDSSTDHIQKYTPKEESAGIRHANQKNENDEKEVKNIEFALKGWGKAKLSSGNENQKETLIGSCRAARIREDTSIIHFQDNFKLQHLVKHPSYK